MTSTNSGKPLLTFEDYLTYDDGIDTRYELGDGELVAMPPESPENLAIARFLLFERGRSPSLNHRANPGINGRSTV